MKQYLQSSYPESLNRLYKDSVCNIKWVMLDDDPTGVYSAQDEKSNIKISAPAGVVPNGTILKVEIISNGDTFDAIYSYRDKERMLEIMKDSRLGTNSLLAIMFLILLKIGFIYSIINNNLLWTVIFMPVVARLGVIVMMYKTVTPRENGMGNLFIGKASTSMFTIAILYTIILIIGILLINLLIFDFLLQMDHRYLVLHFYLVICNIYRLSFQLYTYCTCTILQ